ncbi:sodium-dependent phosphate transport protein 1-like isoform X2 [Parasteatoda tepidariorum]|uniref:sodium-dependent phosphate transport protein 1-like isoform X2 n=1 Tax=Parasteatoda tepidariorum TaxID=114398 RepID=UPI00077FA548|nr:sodium-dependent phosphate transport protein 1-like isoform X2 [Parasteatoda tepidariorum]
MSKTGKFNLEKGGHGIFQRRYVVTLLGFLCGMVTQTHRINISFAIVAMVNTSITLPNLKNRTIADCETSYLESESTSLKVPEFNWNPEIQGYILSAGYIGYLFTQIPGGFLTARYGVKRILITSILGASLCNLVSPAAARIHPYLLAVAQLFRGMFQGPPSAALAQLSARWFPIQERGYLATFLYLGFPMGGFAGSLISGPISEIDLDGGWSLIFYFFGLFGLLVSVLLLTLYAEKPADDTRISERELQYILEHTSGNTVQQNPPIPWKRILTSLPTYALLISMFGQYWMVFYFLTIHPIYMDSILHIPVKENGLLTSGPQLAQVLTGFIACWFSVWLKYRSNKSISFIRKGYNTLACSLYILGMLGLYLSGCDKTVNEIFLFMASSSVGFSFAGCLIVAADLSPTFCGIIMGLGSTVASLSGFIMPILIGYLTKEEQTMIQWHKMFLIAASVVFVSGATFLTLGSAEIQPYDPAYITDTKVETKTDIPSKNIDKKEVTITKF